MDKKVLKIGFTVLGTGFLNKKLAIFLLNKGSGGVGRIPSLLQKTSGRSRGTPAPPFRDKIRQIVFERAPFTGVAPIINETLAVCPAAAFRFVYLHKPTNKQQMNIEMQIS